MLDYSSRFVNGAELRVNVSGYDPRSRPTGVDYVIPSIPGWTDTNALAGTYAFDQFTYRRDDQILSKRYPALGNLPTDTISTGYNTLGVPTALSAISNGRIVDQTTFTNEGRIATRTYGVMFDSLGVQRNYNWNQATGQLTSMTATQNGVTLQNDTFAYDATGNLTMNGHDRPGTASDHTECYQYNGRSQLTAAFTNTTTPPSANCAAPSPGGPAAYNVTYTIDEIGNLTTGPAGAYTYPASGATSTRPHAPSTTSTSTYTWNADGTLATRTTGATPTNYTWDQFDRLTSVTTTTATTAMIYFAGGQRALVKDANGVHLYLDNSERHATATATTNTRTYTLGNIVIATQTRDSTATTPTWHYLLGDIRGSVTLAVQTGTTTTQQQWYDPYGATRGTSTLTATTRGYITQHRDTTTGLNYLNNRYQDPSTGIFLSVDPLVAKTGDPYLYAAGNPTTLSDPSGLDPCSKNGTCLGEYDDQRTLMATSGARRASNQSWAQWRNDHPGAFDADLPSVTMYGGGGSILGLVGTLFLVAAVIAVVAGVTAAATTCVPAPYVCATVAGTVGAAGGSAALELANGAPLGPSITPARRLATGLADDILATNTAGVLDEAASGRVTVLGRFRGGTEEYLGKPGFNVLDLPSKGTGRWYWSRNEAFIDDAIAAGDEIRLVTNPYEPIYSGGNTFQREIRYLKDLGYTFQESGDHWVAVPGR